MPRRRSSCCPCFESSTPSPPPSPRIVDAHPLQRTGTRIDHRIASQMYDPQYADYFKRKDEEARTVQALGLISRRVQHPGNSPVFIPPDMLKTIRDYANTHGGRKTRKYKKRPNKADKKKKRTNRHKSNKRRTNRRK